MRDLVPPELITTPVRRINLGAIATGDFDNMSDITINAQQAAVIHQGLAKAVSAVEETLLLKSAAPYKGALAMEIAAYRNEQTRLAEAFPELPL